jgi:Family of unknown function (DUF5906)
LRTDTEQPDSRVADSALIAPLDSPTIESEIANDAPKRAPILPEGALFPRTSARVMRTLDFNEPQYEQQFTCSYNSLVSGQEYKTKDNWKPRTASLAGHLANLAQHLEGRKDGTCTIFADMLAGERSDVAVKSICAAVLDLDTGITFDGAVARVKKLGCCAVVHTTHSNGTTRTPIKRDTILKFLGEDAEITDESLRRFLREFKRWEESIVSTAEYDGTDQLNEPGKQGRKGIHVWVRHAPITKLRVMVPFKDAYVIANEGRTQAEAIAKWKKGLRAFADLLGYRGEMDASCVDPARLFFDPRHKKADTSYQSAVFGGPLFDWRTLKLPADEPKASKGTDTKERREASRWYQKNKDRFELASMVRDHAPEKVRSDHGGKIECQCPFDELHSNAGSPEDTGCYIVDASSATNGRCVIGCQHGSHCRSLSAPDFIAKMREDKWVPDEAWGDDQYIGEHSDGPNQESDAQQQGEKETYDFYDEKTLVDYIDSICRIVALGAKRRFAFLGGISNYEPQFLSKEDATIELAQYRFHWETEAGNQMCAAFPIWLKSQLRKPNFRAARFEPKLKLGDTGTGILNLWTGFAVTPKQGDWSLLKNHIWENICQMNEEYFWYLMAWMAQLAQEPWLKIGLAVVLRGEVGVGKTKLAEWLGNIIGDAHAMIADKSEQCTGKFNADLECKIFISAEEAFFAGDPQIQGPLKHLITGHKLRYEPKFRDAHMGRNYCRVMMTTNAKFAVQGLARERRYLILDVGRDHQKDKTYFAAIDEQMKNGGAEAMLYDLLNFDYSWCDFQNPPETEALKDIIRRSMGYDEKWLCDVLSEGRFKFKAAANRDDEGWDKEVSKEAIVASYNDHVPSHKNVPAGTQEVQLFLRERIGDLIATKPMVRGKRVPSWKLPSLKDARATYTKVKGIVFDDDAED